MGIFVRIIVAVIAYALFVYLVPLVLAAVEVPLFSSAVWTLIKFCAAIVALIYIWRGPDVTWLVRKG